MPRAARGRVGGGSGVAAKSMCMRVLPSRLAGLLIVMFVSLAALAPAGAGDAKRKTLGTDPAGDSLPAVDLTYLEVGKNGRDLEIRIGVDGMIPPAGGYPEVPGIEWIFKVKKRTFLAEAVARRSAPLFLLFELKGDAYEQIGNVEGTYEWSDGFISLLVPLDAIGATKGTRIVGANDAGDDVDSHVHLPGRTLYTDTFATTKHYVVP